MSWQQETLDALRSSDIDFVAYLPDSILDGLIDDIVDDDEFETVRVVREEQAVSLLGGVWLSGRSGALICQSSGLANCFNAIGSQSIPYRLPFLALVTRRGDLGEVIEPQISAGYGLPDVLDDMGVRNHQLHEGVDVEKYVELAAESTFAIQEPYVLLYERTLIGGKHD